jgi:hypothetical protein
MRNQKVKFKVPFKSVQLLLILSFKLILNVFHTMIYKILLIISMLKELILSNRSSRKVNKTQILLKNLVYPIFN